MFSSCFISTDTQVSVPLVSNGIQAAVYGMNIYKVSDEEADLERVCHLFETTGVWPVINMHPPQFPD